MDENINTMEQVSEKENFEREAPDYPVEVTYLPPQNDNQSSDVQIGGAEIAVGGFAIAGVAAVGYGIYRGIKALINKIRGSEEEDEEVVEEKPKPKKKKKAPAKKKSKKVQKKVPEPEYEEDDVEESEDSEEETEE